MTISSAGAETGLSVYKPILSLTPVGTAETISAALTPWAGLPLSGSLPASLSCLQVVDLERVAEPCISSIPLITAALRVIATGETILMVVPVIDDDPLQIAMQVGTKPPETATSGVTTLKPFPLSDSAPPPDAPVRHSTFPSQFAPLSSATVESVATATTVSPVSLSPSATAPTGEQITPSASATPGSDCTTACFSDLLISAFALLNQKPW